MVSNPQMIGQAETEGTEDEVVELPPLDAQDAVPAPRLDPTRYGDWERNGRCIDF